MPANQNGSKWITPLRRLAVYLRDRWSCAYCGRDLSRATKRQRTLDHLDTRASCARRLAEGLKMHPSSRLVTACRPCNTRRGDMPWREFCRTDAWARGDWAVAEVLRRTRRKLPLERARELMTAAACDADLEASR